MVAPLFSVFIEASVLDFFFVAVEMEALGE